MASFEEYLYEAAVEKDITIIVLTSRNKKSGKYFRTAGKIKEICEKKGIRCYVAYAEEAYILKDNKGVPKLYNIDDKKGISIDSSNTAVLVRGSITKLKASLDLLSQIERHDIFCINSRQTMEECSDKYRTALKMADFGVPTPKTILVPGEVGIEPALKKIGNKFPIVIKTLTGSKGIGVFIADSIEGLKSTLQTIWKIEPETEIIFQEFLEANYDMRIHVLGGKIIASMKRYKIKKDFRSNFSLGGKVETLKLTKEQEEIAILAAKSVDAVWVGVDMMVTKDNKIYVIEINSSPGTEGIEKATGKGIVEMVVNFMANKSNWISKAKECGFIENLTIETIGNMDAKMDTGNGSYCVIHADRWEINNGKVKWENNGKSYEHKVETVKEFRRGGVRNELETRAVILLDVKIAGTTYKDIRFSISNRKNMTTPILMNRAFLRKANLIVNSKRKYIITLKEMDSKE